MLMVNALAVILCIPGVCCLLFLLWWSRVQFHRKGQVRDGIWKAPLVGSMNNYFKEILKDSTGTHNVFLFRLMCGFTEVFRKEKMFRFWICSRPVVMLYSPDTVESDPRTYLYPAELICSRTHGCIALMVDLAMGKVTNTMFKLRSYVADVVHAVVWQHKMQVMESVLTSNKILDKSFEYRLLHPWLGTGLLTSAGAKWRNRRKMLTPTFHFKILEDFAPVVNEQSKVLVQRMAKATSQDYIDAVSYVTLCTLDVICETAMGVHVGAQENSESNYVKALYDVGDTFLARAMRPWLWPEPFFKLSSHGRRFYKSLETLHNFTRQVIRERKAELTKKGFIVADLNANYQTELPEDKPSSKRKAFLDLLLDVHIRHNSISEEEIREEVDTFMFEGHDTTAMGLSWALYLVGRDPVVQDKIHEELDYIFGEDRDRPIEMEDMREMKYMECVIKEAQRLYPSVPYIGRELKEDFIINGYTIPKGTTCCMFFYMLHRDPEIFPNPEKFDPDRFTAENSQGRNPFAYTPFSAGPRNCIGQKFAMMEEKIVLANIFRNFRLHSLDARDVIHTTAEMVIRPKDGIRIQVMHRDS